MRLSPTLPHVESGNSSFSFPAPPEGQPETRAQLSEGGVGVGGSFGKEATITVIFYTPQLWINSPSSVKAK